MRTGRSGHTGDSQRTGSPSDPRSLAVVVTAHFHRSCSRPPTARVHCSPLPAAGAFLRVRLLASAEPSSPILPRACT
ncbi:hypothetical protein [Streptomyces sp. NRRL S-340]|uniref:hypothetical protein n=1 Tax=Streptomyces sp. NRRL S-340 TaxID=1463901 RepID=UPI00056A65CE|nr:hypothetical protein [Streptomyces sp. NRRL S-340]